MRFVQPGQTSKQTRSVQTTVQTGVATPGSPGAALSNETDYTAALEGIRSAINALTPDTNAEKNPLEAGNDTFTGHVIIPSGVEYFAESTTLFSSGHLIIERGATATVYSNLTLAGSITLAGNLIVGN